MKRNAKKMTLSRTTLRILNPKKLAEVGGAVTTTGGPTSDLTYHCTPFPVSQADLCPGSAVRMCY
jgi:hypothetical protein